MYPWPTITMDSIGGIRLLHAPNDMPEIDAINLKGYGKLEYRAIH